MTLAQAVETVRVSTEVKTENELMRSDKATKVTSNSSYRQHRGGDQLQRQDNKLIQAVPDSASDQISPMRDIRG